MIDSILPQVPPPLWTAGAFERAYLFGDAPLPAEVRCHFDGLCEPKNPGGIATAAWAVFGDSGNAADFRIPDKLRTKAIAACRPVRQFAAVWARGGERATNNWAEWVAFGTLLRYLQESGTCRKVLIFGDSKLVVEQYNGGWKCNAEHLILMRDRARVRGRQLARDGVRIEVQHVLREFNMPADSLSESAFFDAASPAEVASFHRVKARRNAQRGT